MYAVQMGLSIEILSDWSFYNGDASNNEPLLVVAIILPN